MNKNRMVNKIPMVVVAPYTFVDSKNIIIDTIGQIPIIGGITGPILKPFKLDVDTIRHLLAIRISVKEVLQLDGVYYEHGLDLNNYRNLAAMSVPTIEEKPLPKPELPPEVDTPIIPPVVEDMHPSVTLPEEVVEDKQPMANKKRKDKKNK